MQNISRRNTGFLEDCSLLVSLNRKCLDLPLYVQWRMGGKPRAVLGLPTGKGLTQLGLQLKHREGTQAGSTYHFPISQSTLPRSWTPLTGAPAFLVPPATPTVQRQMWQDPFKSFGVGPSLFTDDFDCHLDILNQRVGKKTTKFGQMQRKGGVCEEHRGHVGQNIGWHIPLALDYGVSQPWIPVVVTLGPGRYTHSS